MPSPDRYPSINVSAALINHNPKTAGELFEALAEISEGRPQPGTVVFEGETPVPYFEQPISRYVQVEEISDEQRDATGRNG